MKQTLAIMRLFCTLACVIAFASGCGKSNESAKVKLYTLDCGTLVVADMDAFSDDGKSKSQKANLANPCFLIRHPKGNLLWDLGYQEGLADKENGVVFYEHFHKTMKHKLSTQLKQLGLLPTDITHIAISHWHDDHIGNANLFSHAHWLVQEVEYAQLFSAESRSDPDFFKLYSELANAKTSQFKHDIDVFGDKTVLIKWMPGHTNGSTILQLRLNQTGNMLLTGDLYTHADARVHNSVPVFNADKQATLDSRKKFELLAKDLQAKVVIQHEKSHIDTLPAFPNFLD